MPCQVGCTQDFETLKTFFYQFFPNFTGRHGTWDSFATDSLLHVGIGLSWCHAKCQSPELKLTLFFLVTEKQLEGHKSFLPILEFKSNRRSAKFYESGRQNVGWKMIHWFLGPSYNFRNFICHTFWMYLRYSHFPISQWFAGGSGWWFTILGILAGAMADPIPIYTPEN